MSPMSPIGPIGLIGLISPIGPVSPIKPTKMENIIQITGIQYACEDADMQAVMAELDQQKPEVLLVTEQTHDFGIIVRALVGTTFRGVVSRFDREHVLQMMQHDGTSVLVGKVTETDPEGLCYSISISGDYPDPNDTTGDDAHDIWANWCWTGAPLLETSPDDCRLDISIKVALRELQRSGSMNRQTLLEHLALILKLTRWDVSRETQRQLSQIRQLVSRHSDTDVRALAPQLRRTLTAIGSKERARQFQDTYFTQLCQSDAAERMYCRWCDIHRGELDEGQRQQTISRQLEAIEHCLMQLPADLCYQKDHFGALMHRLLYLDIPQRKLLMLQSALVLRLLLQLLCRQLGLGDKKGAEASDDSERQLIRQLEPIFKGNTDNVRDFLQRTKEKPATDITRLVSQWVRQKLINPELCHRPLWTALHDAGIYRPTEANWNMMLEIRRSWK